MSPGLTRQLLSDSLSVAATGRLYSVIVSSVTLLVTSSRPQGPVFRSKSRPKPTHLPVILGAVLRSVLRSRDFAGRNGGEEFAILLPDTEIQPALEIAERIRAAVAGITLPGSDVSVTASIGVVGFPDHATTLDRLEWLADAALYLAKRQGRNRVEVADPAAPDAGAVLPEPDPNGSESASVPGPQRGDVGGLGPSGRPCCSPRWRRAVSTATARGPWRGLTIRRRAAGSGLPWRDVGRPGRTRDAAGMRIAMGAGSEVLGTPVRPQDIVADVEAAEADGFRSAWTVHFSRGVDALTVLAVAGTRTSRIDLGVGIVPTYPRHPLALAQQAATAQAFCGGRLTLGVGVSHQPVIEDLHGLAYQQPAAHMRDYLSVLVPLLREGSVRYRGAFYQVDGGSPSPGPARWRCWSARSPR